MEKELVELKADREENECIEDEFLQLQTKYEQLKASIPSTSFVFIFILLYGLLTFSIPFLYFHVKDTSSASNSVLRHINSTNDIYERLHHRITISEETKIECPTGNVQQATCQPCPKCSIPRCPEMEHPKCESCVCPESEIQDCEGGDVNSLNNQPEAAVRIISTDEHHTILAEMRKQFEDVQLSEPVNLYDIPIAARPQNYMDLVKSMGVKKPDSIIGITKAHILAQLNVIDAASQYGIIFENDAQFNPNFESEEIMRRMKMAIVDLQQVDPNWGVLLFGWCRWGDVPREKVATNLFRVLPETDTDTGCMQAYAISIAAAKKHITYHNMVRLSDAFLNVLHHAKTFTMYLCDPVLVVQSWQLEKKQQWYPKWYGGPIGPDYGNLDMKPKDL